MAVEFRERVAIVTGAGRGLGRLYLAARVAAVAAPEPFTIPTSIFDEVADVCVRLGILG